MLEAYFQVLRLYVTWEFLELMGLWCWPVVNATFTSPSRCATFVVHSALGKYRDLNLDYERGKMQIAAQ
jgi:hypothetical protein